MRSDQVAKQALGRAVMHLRLMALEHSMVRSSLADLSILADLDAGQRREKVKLNRQERRKLVAEQRRARKRLHQACRQVRQAAAVFHAK